ncbi:MAG TPA: hypothetical protein VN648_03090 [Candidatus Methylomirabilis sp.]|nr:hypothetical protein [Candidatus Methylomirabilis sp.]
MLEALFAVDDTWGMLLVQGLWALTVFCAVAAVVVVASLLTASQDDFGAERVVPEGHQLGVSKQRVRELAVVH